MKPLEDLSSAGAEVGEIVWEMQAKEFFYHIGMLVLEGRMPQLSDKGRVEGPHCLPLSGHIGHVCNLNQNKNCFQAVKRKERIGVLWQQDACMCIEVSAHLSEKDTSPLLLEWWKVELLQGADGTQLASDSLLVQAIRSHIHFSQLSAWLCKSQGLFPSRVSYRLYQNEDEALGDFIQKPEQHTFPLASLPNNAALRVTVLSLPRHGIQDLPEKLGDHYQTDKTSPDGVTNGCEVREQELSDDRSPLKKKSCVEREVRSSKNSKQLDGKVPFPLRLQKSEPCVKDKPTSKTNQPPKAYDAVLDTGKNPKTASFKEDYCRHRSLSDGQQLAKKLFPHGRISNSSQKKNEGTVEHALKWPPKTPRAAACQGVPWRLARTDPCSIPVFHPKTGLPVSSSPAPLRRSTTELECEDHSLMNGFSRQPDHYSMLSRSAPASTKQSLLGNFEESLLNGRMEPLGTVEGFTAELGASGAFCPSHVTLPVSAYFFRLSDDDAPSPYLGYITLDQPSICKRGYHIPNKGTVQLTVFNPSKTVVKVFVVLYDATDMPPLAQTFIRQKTFSAPVDCPDSESQACLHFLIHLRFASSKSGRIYLHTDVRVIFAQQPPDLSSRFRVWTVTSGPTDPKYTPRTDTRARRHRHDTALAPLRRTDPPNGAAGLRLGTDGASTPRNTAAMASGQPACEPAEERTCRSAAPQDSRDGLRCRAGSSGHRGMEGHTAARDSPDGRGNTGHDTTDRHTC